MSMAAVLSMPAYANRENRALLVIVSLGLALRLLVMALFPHVPESDEIAYLDMALNLVNRHEIIDAAGNRAFYNAGYSMFLLAPIFYVLGKNLLAVKLAHAVLGALSIVLCHRVAAAAGAGARGRLFAAAAWAVYLPSSVYGVYLAKENLMIPLILTLFWLSLKSLRKPSLRMAAGAGGVLGMLALIGNAGLILSSIFIAALVLAPAKPAAKAGMLAATLACAMVIAGPWMVRNWFVVGGPVLNTNGGFNLYLGNNANASALFTSIADTPRGPTWHALRAGGELQATETLKKEAIAWIVAHPGDFARLALDKAITFWTPPVHAGKYKMTMAEVAVRAAWAIEFIVLGVLALGGLLSARLRHRSMMLLWAGVLVYTAVHMIFYVIFRYREPIMPIVVILAALGVERFSLWFRERRRQEGRGLQARL